MASPNIMIMRDLLKASRCKHNGIPVAESKSDKDQRLRVRRVGPEGVSPMNVKSSLMVLLAGTSLIFTAGCTTKNYVRQQTQPIIDKTNTLDDLTAKNTRDIRDVESRAQQGIQGVNDRASQADAKAVDARGRADQAQTLASQASNKAEALATQVANLDNYRPVVETSVHFGFNKANLTNKSKEALDQLLAEVPNTKGYLLVVEG